MIDIAHRLACVAVIVAGPLLLSADLAAAEAEAVPATISFVVHRDGSQIGTHRLTFHTETGPDGERLIVDTAIDIRVRAAFVTLYHYTFRGRETWQGDKLMAMESSTDDDGKKLQVHVEASEAGLKVDSTEAHYVAPADTLPDSYWRPDTVKHQHFIDTEDGKLVDLISTPVGHSMMTYAGKPVDLSTQRVSRSNPSARAYPAPNAP